MAFIQQFGNVLTKALHSLVFLLVIPMVLQAQELECSVELKTSNINTTSVSHIDNLPGIIESYINEHDWLNDTFEEIERIEFKIIINILSVGENNDFEANIIVNTQRPIYNTMSNTTLITINDNNWNFKFPPGKTINHDLLQYNDIATVLDYYSLIVLGFDYDSFSELGGDPHFNQAQSLVEIATTSGASGWSGNTSSNIRPKIVSLMLNPAYEAFRKAYYTYHRKGLDLFTTKPEEARKNVMQCLTNLLDTKRRTSDNYLFDRFFETKHTELIGIFDNAETDLRLEAYNLLSELDPNNADEYEELQQ